MKIVIKSNSVKRDNLMKRIILLCLDFNASIQIQKNKEVYLKQFITRNELEQTSIQLQLSFFLIIIKYPNHRILYFLHKRAEKNIQNVHWMKPSFLLTTQLLLLKFQDTVNRRRIQRKIVERLDWIISITRVKGICKLAIATKFMGNWLYHNLHKS